MTGLKMLHLSTSNAVIARGDDQGVDRYLICHASDKKRVTPRARSTD